MGETKIDISVEQLFQAIDKIISEYHITGQTKIYGVPTGGLYIAMYIAGRTGARLVEDPEDADVIVDDVLDSGATREKFRGYQKPFIPVFIRNGQYLVFPYERIQRKDEIEDLVIRFFEVIGEDPRREGLLKTPARVKKALQEILAGYSYTYTPTVFHEDIKGVVKKRNIPFYSLCEHHLLPFFGKVDVEYEPQGKILGASKLARIVEKHSKRLQIQERMGRQIAEEVKEITGAKKVVVTIKARHLCIEMRGVKHRSIFETRCEL